MFVSQRSVIVSVAAGMILYWLLVLLRGGYEIECWCSGGEDMVLVVEEMIWYWVVGVVEQRIRN